MWKHVFVVEVLKHRYPIQTPEAKTNLLQNLRSPFGSKPSRILTLNYLDEFGDRFWCETDERVIQIGEKFSERVQSEGDVGASLAGVRAASGADHETLFTQESQREIVARYQRVVNETQIARLNETIQIINDTVLDSPQHFTYLVIDDLDKQWVDDELMIPLVRCLFDAVADMARVQHLKILIALRTNIFRQLNYGSQRRGMQEEKIQGMVLPIRWTENDLRLLLEQRVQAASTYYDLSLPLSLSNLLPSKGGKGPALDYILKRTLMRPRDAIMFLNAALREGAGKNKLSWDNIYKAEALYSKQRLDALRDEWKDPYFDIDKVFEPFRGKSTRLTRSQFTEVLDDVVLVLANRQFKGTPWLTGLSEPVLESSGGKSWYETYGALTRFFYEISLVGLATTAKGPAVYSYQAEAELDERNIPETAWFEVHPAFNRALDIRAV